MAFTDSDAVTAWNAGANAWDTFLESGADYYRHQVHGPAICHWNMPRLTYHWSTPYWRYTLSEWASLVLEAGFVISGLREPRPTADQVAANPHLEDCSRMPFFLIFELWKPPDVSTESGA